MKKLLVFLTVILMVSCTKQEAKESDLDFNQKYDQKSMTQGQKYYFKKQRDTLLKSGKLLGCDSYETVVDDVTLRKLGYVHIWRIGFLINIEATKDEYDGQIRESGELQIWDPETDWRPGYLYSAEGDRLKITTYKNLDERVTFEEININRKTLYANKKYMYPYREDPGLWSYECKFYDEVDFQKWTKTALEDMETFKQKDLDYQKKQNQEYEESLKDNKI